MIRKDMVNEEIGNIDELKDAVVGALTPPKPDFTKLLELLNEPDVVSAVVVVQRSSEMLDVKAVSNSYLFLTGASLMVTAAAKSVLDIRVHPPEPMKE